MSSDLITLDFHLPASGRLRPFVSGGAGHTSARLRVGDGGHAYYEYGPASSLQTRFWGFALDMRIYRRLVFTPMVSSTSANGPDSKAQHCTAYNYLSGDFSSTCSTLDSPRYAVRGLSLGIGIR